MSGTRAVPPEPEGGTERYSVPQAARYLGISERAVRKQIETGKLTAERDGARWLVILPAAPERGTGTAQGGTTRGTRAVPEDEPIEATYRVDGATAATLVPVTALLDQATDFADRIERLTREAMAAAAERDQLRRRAETAEDRAETLQARLEALEASQAAQEAHSGPLRPLRVSQAAIGEPEGTGATPAPWWRFWERW